MNPLLSILMPTYQGERYVRDALASIGIASPDELELVVVDDGSTDATLAIVASFATRVPTRVVQGPRSRNWVAGTNAALAAARGRFACFLHQDDGWMPGRFDRIRASIRAHPDATLFLAPSRFVDSERAQLGTWDTPFEESGAIAASRVVESLLVQNFLAIPAPVFQVATARAVGGLDESLWYTADWDFWLALAKRGGVVHDADARTWFRVHAASQTVTRSIDAGDFRRQMSRVLERHLPEGGARGAEGGSIEAAARFSIEVNVALATLSHGRTPDLGAFGRAVRGLDVDAASRFLRDSRIVDRVGARLVNAARARLRR